MLGEPHGFDWNNIALSRELHHLRIVCEYPGLHRSRTDGIDVRNSAVRGGDHGLATQSDEVLSGFFAAPVTRKCVIGKQKDDRIDTCVLQAGSKQQRQIDTGSPLSVDDVRRTPEPL